MKRRAPPMVLICAAVTAGLAPAAEPTADGNPPQRSLAAARAARDAGQFDAATQSPDRLGAEAQNTAGVVAGDLMVIAEKRLQHAHAVGHVAADDEAAVDIAQAPQALVVGFLA
ncbi:MAG TPA: hypothetical protein VGD25_00975, partial [Immundisolibacter sp.]